MGWEIDLTLLASLIVISEEGSLGRAAPRLHISQPALSMQIRRLEERVGVPLLERSWHGVVLTPAGELAVREGRRLLSASAALLEHLQELEAGERPALRVGFIGTGAAELTPSIVRGFRERCPEVELRMHEFPFSDPLMGLGDGRSDVGVLRPPADGLERFEMIELFTEPVVVVVSGDHRLAGRSSVEVADLLEEPWFVEEAEGSYRDFWTLQSHRRAPAPTVNTNADWWLTVASGRAICLAPASAARYERRPELVFVPVEDAEPSVCALAWHRDDGERPDVRALVEAATEAREKRPEILRQVESQPRATERMGSP
jgi:DNA-binding transcriptional LysR family regulator